MNRRFGVSLVAVVALWTGLIVGADTGPIPSLPRELPGAEAWKKARVDGKYRMLLRQFRSPNDAIEMGEFRDRGYRSAPEHGAEKNLPAGYWVYVYPHWYIWRDRSDAILPPRGWGPEQAVGEPNVAQAGDSQSAWASRGQDDQEEWLLLEYSEPIVPKKIVIHENYCPGALSKIVAYKLDGTAADVWSGTDPTSSDQADGVSEIPLKIDYAITRVRVVLDSPNVAGWNEIDAVGLVDKQDKKHWAVVADASSTYAQPRDPAVDHNRVLQARVEQLEEEVKELRKLIRQLQDQTGQKP